MFYAFFFLSFVRVDWHKEIRYIYTSSLYVCQRVHPSASWSVSLPHFCVWPTFSGDIYVPWNTVDNVLCMHPDFTIQFRVLSKFLHVTSLCWTSMADTLCFHYYSGLIRMEWNLNTSHEFSWWCQFSVLK